MTFEDVTPRIRILRCATIVTLNTSYFVKSVDLIPFLLPINALVNYQISSPILVSKQISCSFHKCSKYGLEAMRYPNLVPNLH